MGQAIGDFNMIEPGDKVMVCLSGGKDSYALLDILLSACASVRRCQVRASSRSTSTRSSPASPKHVLPEYLKSRGVPFHIEQQDTYSVVKEAGARGQDDVQPVLAAAPRHPVPRGR